MVKQEITLIMFIHYLTVAPEIDKAPQYSKAAGDQGSTVQLFCNAQGAPEVTFSWSKVSQEFTTLKI